ncbi:MAG: hypothetical protein ACTSRU_16635, partial [Candidatus Hodarchaeales archaeon]
GKDVRLKNRVFLPGRNYPGIKNTLEYELKKLLDSALAASKKEKVEDVSIPDQPVGESNNDDFTNSDPGPERKEAPSKFLRQEFPKLKFEELPDDLKVLLIDRIALYNKAKQAREDKYTAENEEDRHKFNKIEIECMMGNLLIWDELNHFSKTKKILGKHPRFKANETLAKYKNCTKAELIKKKNQLPSSRTKAKQGMEGTDDEKIIAAKQGLLDKYDLIEKGIDELLGI